MKSGCGFCCLVMLMPWEEDLGHALWLPALAHHGHSRACEPFSLLPDRDRRSSCRRVRNNRSRAPRPCWYPAAFHVCHDQVVGGVHHHLIERLPYRVVERVYVAVDCQRMCVRDWAVNVHAGLQELRGKLRCLDEGRFDAGFVFRVRRRQIRKLAASERVDGEFAHRFPRFDLRRDRRHAASRFATMAWCRRSRFGICSSSRLIYQRAFARSASVAPFYATRAQNIFDGVAEIEAKAESLDNIDGFDAAGLVVRGVIDQLTLRISFRRLSLQELRNICLLIERPHTRRVGTLGKRVRGLALRSRSQRPR